MFQTTGQSDGHCYPKLSQSGPVYFYNHFRNQMCASLSVRNEARK